MIFVKNKQKIDVKNGINNNYTGNVLNELIKNIN